MPERRYNSDIQDFEIVPGSYNYRSKWVCFKCFKSFTKTLKTIEEKEVRCPYCQEFADDMGYLFEASSKRDKNSWKSMKLLKENGFTFHSVGSVAFINYRLTNNNKASFNEVKRNIEVFLYNLKQKNN